ncbi:AMIN domain-containing protein [Phormidium tenue FACHB-886]|nr:AMIN domain-containing protein [Phormidium tenue FACHB-886]
MVGSAAMLMMMAQPANAAATQITNVQLSPSDSGVEVTLQTRNGDRPQVFTVKRGNALIADIVNTQLQLPEGNDFTQSNPAPGISSVTVSQLDANSVRVTVSGDSNPPSAEVDRGGRGLVLSVNSTGEATQAATPVPSVAPVAPAPAVPPASPPAAIAQNATPPAPSTQSSPAPNPQSSPVAQAQNNDVLVPNPGVTIDGVPVLTPTTVNAPPLQPRAVAPPLGDISVSSTDSTPSAIDLGTTELVPRLVLRDAPVRDVLSLLARAAGLNVAYIDAPTTDDAAQTGGGTGEAGAGADNQVRISLDIENEPVQSVFNYVLRVAGLEANRSGRTIFVAPRLPDAARNVITRTLRLNQVVASDAAAYLATLGVETRQFIPSGVSRTTSTQGDITTTSETVTEPRVATVNVEQGDSPLLLQGVAATADPRLNSITLVGEPQRVAAAVSILSQLDLRRRQVAVNVKIVDVNLLATDNANTSFSFGVDDAFISSDGGAASLNFGGVRPPSNADVTGSRLTPPITNAPFPAGSDNEPFLDPQPNAPFGTGDSQTFANPPLNDGTIQIPGGTYGRPPFGTNNNPLQPGVTDATGDTVEYGLPTLFQYPTRFLANLQTQVVSGNAKILTDPTLVVQEGQQARVNLGQEVISQVDVEFTDSPGGTRETRTIQKALAGLTLTLNVDRIDDNGFVTLTIAPRVTSPVSTQDLGNGSQATLLTVRELDSGRLRLRDGQTLIVSGIIQDSDRTTVSKVPILGDIPILGALFRNTNRQNTRQEVIILLTPQILNDSDTSSFGYRYTPNEGTQQFLRQQGVETP